MTHTDEHRDIIRTLRPTNFPLSNIYRNRSGYEGCTFLIEGDPTQSITAKSNEFKERYFKAKDLPIVIFSNMALTSVNQIRVHLDKSEYRQGTYQLRYYSHNRLTKKGVIAFIRWFGKNGISIENLKIDENEGIQVDAYFSFPNLKHLKAGRYE